MRLDFDSLLVLVEFHTGLAKMVARPVCTQVKRLILSDSNSAACAYAIATGRAERDSAADLRGAIKSHATTPRAAITQPEKVGALLRAIYGYDGNFLTRTALQVLALTFLRPGEVRFGEWAEIDFEQKLWRIPAKRMKMRQDHIVPLSPQCCEILQGLHEITGKGQFMFPGVHGKNRVISDVTILAALRRMGYEKTEMSAHGFRAMASTLLNELGFPADAIEKQLAHNPKNKIRGIYNRAEYLPERRRMMDEWAIYLDKLRTNAGDK